MPRARRVDLRSYRLHRLEVIDDGAAGWRVIVHAASGMRAVARLQSGDPAGLAVLIADAQVRVDRLIDAQRPAEGDAGQRAS